MVTILGFMLLVFGSPKAQAHEWSGDKWAPVPITFEKLVIRCEELIKLSYDSFIESKECNVNHLVTEVETVSTPLFAAFDYHPATTPVIIFIKEHFNDVELGKKSIVALSNSITRIKTILAYMELYEVDKQERIKERPSLGDIPTI